MRVASHRSSRGLLTFCLSAALCAACVKLPREKTSVTSPSQNSLSVNSTPLDHAATPPRLNLNTATREELARLPGIGEALAARIVEHRERHGAFRRAEHLMLVRGMSDRRFRELRAHVTAE